MTGCGDVAALTAAHINHQLRGDVDNSAWDGPAAMSACSNSDTPASCFSAICAGKKAGDTSTQDAWALPHHKHPGDPPNHNGVANALAQFSKTEGLTNSAAAKAHLQAHMNAISGSNAAGAPSLAEVRAMRAAALGGQRRGLTGGAARLEPFRAHFIRRENVVIGGKEMAPLDGYASITGIEYEMYDMFGLYYEQVAPAAFDATLAASPDVAFLLNHRGMTMARTTNGTLELDADPRGLHARAFVNPARSDIADLLTAIDDKLITEMSFAFMILDGGWDEEYMHFSIDQVDINRGDVSAVNYGANPYTSIEARARQILADLDHLPAGAQRAALASLRRRFPGAAVLRQADPATVDDLVSQLVASLDATLDEGANLATSVGHEGLPPAAAQALDLITAASAIVDELMGALGIFDPDGGLEAGAGTAGRRSRVQRFASPDTDDDVPEGWSVGHVARNVAIGGDEAGKPIRILEQLIDL